MNATPTSEKLNTPHVRQFSVFLRNKVGALLEVVKLLEEETIIVLGLSIAEASESSITRMIVSDPERVVELFRKHDVAFSECDVMVVELKEGPGDLPKVLASLLMAEVNIHFSFPLLIRPNGRALIVVHLDDTECACSVLMGDGFRVLHQGDLSR